MFVNSLVEVAQSSDVVSVGLMLASVTVWCTGELAEADMEDVSDVEIEFFDVDELPDSAGEKDRFYCRVHTFDLSIRPLPLIRTVVSPPDSGDVLCVKRF